MTTAQQLLARSAGKQPESAILDQCRAYLRMKGWLVVRMQQGIGCHKGISDLIAIRNRRVVFAEIKTARGRLSEHQMGFRHDVTEHGGEYVVWRSLEDLLEWEKEARG